MSSDWVTTSLVLDGLRLGKDEAWRAFVARFRDPLIRLGVRRGLSTDDAEDASQRILLVFCDGIRHGRYERGKGRLSAWLFGIARLEIRRGIGDAEKRRVRGQAGTDSTVLSDLEDVAAENEEKRIWREEILRTLLDRVRGEFATGTWEAFERVQMKGESPEAVAIALAVSKNAVFIAKHRVLTRLRELERDLEDAT